MLKDTNSVRIIKGTYYSMSFIYTLATSVIWAVNTLFLLGAGLNIQEVFIANSFYAVAMSLFEIPTGVFADTLGRRFSFLFSVITLSLATFAYLVLSWFSFGVLAYSIVSLFLGLGYTFYSGAMEAWLVDALNKLQDKSDMDSVFAKAGRFSGIAMLGGSIGGGYLGAIDLSIPYYTRSILLLLCWVIGFFFMFDLGFKKHSFAWNDYGRIMKDIAVQSIQFGWKAKSVRLLILASGIGAGLYFMWAFYSLPPLFQILLDREDIASIAGYISAAIAICSIIGSVFVNPLMKLFRSRSALIIFLTLIQLGGALVIGTAANVWMASLGIFLFMTPGGAMLPVRQTFLHSLIPSDKRATIVSFDSLVSNGFNVVGQNALGAVARLISIPIGYILGSVSLILSIPFLGRLNRMKKQEDLIRQDNTA